MWTDIDICYICLRTDRKLKVGNDNISKLHRQFCDISFQMDHNPKYCYECEHLLKKINNFMNKCVKAMHILEKWIKTENIVKSDISSLWTLLPASLDFALPNNCSIIVYEDYSADKENADLLDVQDTIENSDKIDLIKSENIEVLNKVVIKNEKTEIEEILLRNDEQILNGLKIDEVNDDLTENDMTEFDGMNDKELCQDSESSSDDTLINILENAKRKNKENNKKTARKRSFDKIDKETDKSMTKRIKTKLKGDIDKIETKKEKRHSDAMSKEDGNKKVRFRTRSKGFLTEMTNGFEAKLKNGRTRKSNYSKERLIQVLESKFANCGDITTSDGTVIDKQFILSCLQDKATDYVMKQLYVAVHCKSTFQPKALKLFKCIQNKFRNEYDSVFEIEYLNTMEKMYEELDKRKTYGCYINSEFKCDICYQGFKHAKQLQNHLKCHDKSTGDIECPVCKMRFRRHKSLVSHRNTHEAVYKCKLCPLITYHRHSMVNHYLLHKGMTYKCDQCFAVFGSVSAHRTHMSYRHARTHACVRCGRGYSTRIGLLAHCTRYHADEGPEPDRAGSVKCEECSLTLATWEAYNRHLRFTHNHKTQIGRPPGSTSTSGSRQPSSVARKRPVMTCRVCDAVGHSRGWLQLHFVEQHPSVDMNSLYSDKHTHLCDICGKSFAEHPLVDMNSLYSDKHTHLCDICGKSFASLHTLRAHLNVHSGLRPYACVTCNARFHRPMSLRLHKLIHQPANRPCGVCGKKFKSASNLNNHMRSHIGNRRYKCNICGKGFIHRNSVNEHVRGVHKNIRRVRKRGVQVTAPLETVKEDNMLPKNVLD